MNLPWLTSISRMLSQQAISIKDYNGVTPTKHQSIFVCILLIQGSLVEYFIYHSYSIEHTPVRK